MATLLFSALGTVFGGPLGGAIGALAGNQIDRAIIGSGRREGPRLKDLSVTTSSYGAIVPRLFGQMRVAGSIIWATELVEHSQTQGGGKGKPSVTSYSYSASFAVALSSRPVRSIGRIWADGNLLRGVSGDLKANGIMRLHSGEHDQLPDPLIAAAEGADRCPAFRGLAYVVFEDLDLSNFFNRIPTLTFEVIADDEPLNLQLLAEAEGTKVEADVALSEIGGIASDGTLADMLSQLSPFYALDCSMSGGEFSIGANQGAAPPTLPQPAVSVDDGDFGGASGFSRRRGPRGVNHASALRYYDMARDYQPGLQRVGGRGASGQARTLDLPVAMQAANAANLVDRMARKTMLAGETIAWRTAELDSRLGPGALVRVPGQAGVWRVTEWEWRASGIELMLARAPHDSPSLSNPATDPGRFNPPTDADAAPTFLHAFELPWDGSGNSAAPKIHAAVSSGGAGWDGAALFVDNGDGALQPLGPSGRRRAIVGTAQTILAGGGAFLLDRRATVTVSLLGGDMVLADASPRDLAGGANRALLGEEIIQFGKAVSLGGGVWQLSQLLRGRGGTEVAIPNHVADEVFVLLNADIIRLDNPAISDGAATRIAALGRGDETAVTAAIGLRGITRRPLSPVHPRVALRPDGDIELCWTRRARAAWQWLDGVDTPLHEEREDYRITFGTPESAALEWSSDQPKLVIPSAQLPAPGPDTMFRVQQRGSYAISEALALPDPR